ncbi:MAG: WD40/YVTN/BNR-like repeat-containing protein [Anaerolineae bacterium]
MAHLIRAVTVIMLCAVLALAGCQPTLTPTVIYPTITAGSQATATGVNPKDVTPEVSPTATAQPTLTPTEAVTAPLESILGMSFIDARVGWILGEACVQTDTLCQSRQVVLRTTTDGGLTWHPLPAPDALSVDSLSKDLPRVDKIMFTDSRNGWLYGESTFYTNDGGLSWSLSGDNILALNYTGNWLWAVKTRAAAWQVVTSDDFGKTWYGPPEQPAWTGDAPQLAAFNEQQAWVMSHTDFNWYLWRTTDGGQTWNELPATDVPLRSARLIAVDAGGGLWLFSADQPGGDLQNKAVYRSPDGGSAWQLVAGPPTQSITPCNLPLTGGLQAAEHTVATNGTDWFVALNRYTLIRSANAGCNWSEAIPFAQANLGDATVFGVVFNDSLHGWAAASPNRLFITSDGGSTWSMVTVQ